MSTNTNPAQIISKKKKKRGMEKVFSALPDLQIGGRLGSRVGEVSANGLLADHFSIGVVGVIAFECPVQEGSLFPSLP
ncbi:hypothetical protein FH972_026956 [Carpinus fangiana]|uniref:Uncharacterized protein n=1 Tax=Carpinus fangiana TaxID=176857 RepID=A0A5N6L5X1_9ROSI|nr:hypothetical protein FH972_026956 [Carpinus fangiana]